MFKRSIETSLKEWAQRKDRKVLVLRGARQVGKTTAVEHFARNFGAFLYFNLEIPQERDLFERAQSFEDLVAAMFLFKNMARSNASVLIFVDEIQCSPKAVGWMRYFHECAPQWHVVAAGSLLESAIDVDLHFPVGRVEYLFLKPATFKEFLAACGEKQLLQVLSSENFPEYAHDRLMKMFFLYALVGGMPEAVSEYVKNRDIVMANAVYERLLRAYIDDTAKYAFKKSLVHAMQFAVEGAFLHAGERIVFAKFGNTNYGSREMSDALHTLEKAMLVTLMYPTTAVDLPMLIDRKKHRVYMCWIPACSIFLLVFRKNLSMRMILMRCTAILLRSMRSGRNWRRYIRASPIRSHFGSAKKNSPARRSIMSFSMTARLFRLKSNPARSGDCVRCMNLWIVVRMTSRCACAAQDCEWTP